METKKELYKHLATQCKIYLPMVQLTRAFEDLQDSRNRMKALTEIEKDPRYQHYKDKAKGAYVLEDKREETLSKVRKEVIQLDALTGKKINEYPSLYFIRHNTEFDEGNISRAIKTGGTAGGFKWKFKDE